MENIWTLKLADFGCASKEASGCFLTLSGALHDRKNKLFRWQVSFRLTKEEEEVPTILVVLPIIMRKMDIISPRAFFPIWLHDAQPNEIVMCLFTFCTDFVDDRFSLAHSSSKDVSWKSIWDYIDLKQYRGIPLFHLFVSHWIGKVWSVMGSIIDKLQFCRCRFAVCLVLSCSVVCADLMNGRIFFFHAHPL